jgi:hypothetical protein
MKVRQLLHSSLFASAVITVASAWTTTAAAAPILFSDSGANAAAIQDGVDAFRAALGNPNNGNTLASLPSGRREINWDGGGPPVINGTPPVTPFIVFQNTRGATFTTPGTGLTQAAATGGLLSLDLINPTYASAFSTFSANRLFTPVGSNITDATFSVPGTSGGVPATVTGFGAVFTDVDLGDSTTIQFFSQFGASLGSFNVPAGTTSEGSLSFLGVLFDAGERIGRVRITSGNTALGPTDNPGGGVDVVVMDDFLYAEPQRVPEPASLALLLLGTTLMSLIATRSHNRTTDR